MRERLRYRLLRDMANELAHPVTLITVARYAGVSTSTVSRVLNNKGELSEETRRKVFDAIQTLVTGLAWLRKDCVKGIPG